MLILELVSGTSHIRRWRNMTRINCVEVSSLHNSHLVAEYRELPRVFKLAHNAAKKGFKQSIDSYRMGEGHVKFFYDKLMYLATRHEQLVFEMKKRGYVTNIVNVGLSWLDDTDNDNLWNDWTPTTNDVKVNQDRINTRLAEMNNKKRKN